MKNNVVEIDQKTNSFLDSSVLILTYARITNTLDILELLLKSTNSNIFIFQDAPKSQIVESSQELLIRYLKALPKESKNRIKFKRNNSNQGIAVSMISALDWFFNCNDFGVIVEDDLVFNSDFLRWCAFANSQLRSDKSIFLISGNRYLQYKGMESKSILTRYPQTWGWATWRDRWKLFRGEMGYLHIRISDFFSRRDSFWLGGTLRVLSGKTDTWDILVSRYMYKKKLFSALPPVNLVSNIGNDSSAIHTIYSSFPIRFPISPLNFEKLFIDQSDSAAIRDMDNFLEQMVFNIKPKHVFSSYKNLSLVFCRQHLTKRLDSNLTVEIEI